MSNESDYTKDVKNETLGLIKAFGQRFSNPFFTSFVICWTTWNFQVLLVVFSSLSVYEKMGLISQYSRIKNYMPNLYGFGLGHFIVHALDFFVIPLGVSAIIFCIYKNYGAKYSKEWNSTSNEIKKHSEDHFNALQSRYDNMKDKLQTDITHFVEKSNSIKSSITTELENYQQALDNLKEKAEPHQASLEGILKVCKKKDEVDSLDEYFNDFIKDKKELLIKKNEELVTKNSEINKLFNDLEKIKNIQKRILPIEQSQADLDNSIVKLEKLQSSVKVQQTKLAKKLAQSEKEKNPFKLTAKQVEKTLKRCQRKSHPLLNDVFASRILHVTIKENWDYLNLYYQKYPLALIPKMVDQVNNFIDEYEEYIDDYVKIREMLAEYLINL
ncbi:hypothetical protein AAEX28_07135 [Lentisphaerota bacterium WC36G]|nr:hypothetical protein LJT99_10000 [Lentisphaerae bacterium WC36]